MWPADSDRNAVHVSEVQFAEASKQSGTKVSFIGTRGPAAMGFKPSWASPAQPFVGIHFHL